MQAVRRWRLLAICVNFAPRNQNVDNITDRFAQRLRQLMLLTSSIRHSCLCRNGRMADAWQSALPTSGQSMPLAAGPGSSRFCIRAGAQNHSAPESAHAFRLQRFNNCITSAA
jgi:hypothetical protein